MKQLGARQENKGTHWVRGQAQHEEMHPSSPMGASLCQLGKGQADGKELGPCLPSKGEQGSNQVVREQRGSKV